MVELAAPIAARSFTAADQAAFGVLSGDTNPLHSDPVDARRTQAGAWVVHGANALLWALDAVLGEAPAAAPPSSLKVRFERFIYLDEEAALYVLERSPAALRAEIRVAGVRTIGVTLGFGARRAARPAAATGPLQVGASEAPPLAHSLDELAGLSGSLAFARPPREAAGAYPRAAAVLGAARVAGIAALSRLSGMVCPGLHSITSAYSLDFVDGQEGATELFFATARVAARFRLATVSVWGAGLAGTMDSFARRPPVTQRAYAEVRKFVAPGAFAGSRVLVLGGSRGLGEIAAKVAAAGGADTTLSYAVGRADAEQVVREIEAGGGACRAVPVDVRAPLARQLRELAPTHVYYFATPRIFRAQSGLFSPEALAEFTRFYVDGFFETCRLLAGDGPLAAFYPSTELVADPPRDALEYAMAKAAGEVLCTGLARLLPPVRVVMRRLPRVLTDQTAALRAVAAEDPLDVMLPIVHAVQAA